MNNMAITIKKESPEEKKIHQQLIAITLKYGFGEPDIRLRRDRLERSTRKPVSEFRVPDSGFESRRWRFVPSSLLVRCTAAATRMAWQSVRWNSSRGEQTVRWPGWHNKCSMNRELRITSRK